MKVTGALFHTQGGLVVDDEARVVWEDGGKAENLYAAGGAATGVSGSRASGYLSGNGLLRRLRSGASPGARRRGGKAAGARGLPSPKQFGKSA